MRTLRRPLVIAAVSIAVLAPIGGTVSAATAGEQHATAAAATQPELDVAITPGSAFVTQAVSISVSGTYTCNDLAGTRRVPITLTLAQGANTAEGSTTVACQTGTTAGKWTITAVSVQAKMGTQISATATITDSAVPDSASDEAYLVANTLFVSTDPTFTINAAGDDVITGTYTCTVQGSGDIQVSVSAVSSGTESAGTALVHISCPATSASFSAPVQLSQTAPAVSARHGTAIDPASTGAVVNVDVDAVVNAVIAIADRSTLS